MDAVLSILLEKGGLSGALLLVALYTIYRLYTDQQRERASHQGAIAAAQAALQAEHEKRLDDQRRATEALLAQNDRVHAALDRTTDLIELVQQQRPIGRRTPL